MSRLYPLFLFLIILSACSSKPEKIYKIGVSQCSEDEWRDKMNNEMRREMLFHDDAEIEIVSADDSNEKQIADIQSFIDRNFDVIIVAPNEAEALTPIIKKAYDKGIPVLIFDRRIIGDSYTAYIDLDNRGIGYAAAEYANSILNPNDKNTVIEITGLAGSSPAQERHEGFVEGMAKFPSMKLVESVPGDWERETATHMIDSLLNLHPDTKLIYAHSDNMAIGIANLLKEKGREDIKILGTDASPGQGLEAVKDSIIDATFIYPTEGHRIITTAFAILNNEPYEKTVHIPSLASVDKSNAEILLRQNELLKDETNKVLLLDSINDGLESKYDSLSRLLHTIIVLAIVLAVIFILLLVLFIRNRKLQKELGIQNKSLEEERDKQKELYRQLDEATNSKLAFFTNVSHDLRTPLTLVYEPLHQLALKNGLDKKDDAMIRLASKNTEILRRLIDDILDFQKHENGHSKLLLQETKVVPLFKEWTELFLNSAAKRHISLSFKSNSDKDDSCSVDVEKIQRVFFNILSNAFRYTPANGKIVVDCEINHDYFSFSVSDSGIGIKQEDIKRIFENFFRSDDVKPKGSGIGLAVAKEFVELHNGTLDVESQPGKGSTFTVKIPVVHSEEAITLPLTPLSDIEVESLVDDIEDSSVTFSDDKPLALVIDDNQDIRFLLKETLGNDYNVITAPDGRKGSKLALKYIPDIVICDIMMPEMDGLECCSIIKKDPATSHIPVLMLTACKLDEQRMQSYQSGADAFISKPFKGEILLARCANLIENKQRIKDLYSGVITVEDKKDDSHKGRTDSLSLENDFYSRFINILKTFYQDPSLNTETLAQKMNLGGAQLTRKIKALTNFTPVEILRNYRLEQARKLLLTTDKNINEITFEVGFSSAPYLTKCFREHFGLTPTDLRSQK